MPLVNTKELLKKTCVGGYAVVAFNVNNRRACRVSWRRVET